MNKTQIGLLAFVIGGVVGSINPFLFGNVAGAFLIVYAVKELLNMYHNRKCKK